VYALIRRWRAGEGVASDLLPGRSSGGRGGARLPDEVETIVREVLRSRYLTRQRRSVAAVCREIARRCRMRGLAVPSRGTVLRRIGMLDPVKSVSAREGADVARSRRSAGGVPPEVTGLLEQVQIDHTPVDVIVVDERHRLPMAARTSRRRSACAAGAWSVWWSPWRRPRRPRSGYAWRTRSLTNGPGWNGWVWRRCGR